MLVRHQVNQFFIYAPCKRMIIYPQCNNGLKLTQYCNILGDAVIKSYVEQIMKFINCVYIPCDVHSVSLWQNTYMLYLKQPQGKQQR